MRDMSALSHQTPTSNHSMKVQDFFVSALAQIRASDPTAKNGFRANVLETPKAIRDRRTQHRVEALKIRREKTEAQMLQFFLNDMRELEKVAKAERRAEKFKEAKRRASEAGVYVPKEQRHKTVKPVEKQSAKPEDTIRALEVRIETLDGTVAELTRDNVALRGELSTLKHERDSLIELNTNLSEIRSTQTEPMTCHEVRDVLTKMCVDGQYQPTPEEALKCVSGLYGDRVHILDAAWESARKLGYYANGRRLLSLLMRLVTSYIDAMREGGDGLAKHVFTTSEFSTRESDTVMRSKAHVKARTWTYQNRELTMQRHLKIGVSTDTKLAIRVYFDYLPDLNRVVIGWCGEHLPVPGITS